MKNLFVLLSFFFCLNSFSQPISAVFSLDLSLYNGSYNSVEFYRGGINYPMVNNGNNIFSYTTTVPPFQTSNYTYKFMVDGIAEQFTGNENCIIITSASDTTRLINLNIDTPSLVCWESCNSCVSIISGCTDSTALNYDSIANLNNDSCEYNVTFYVDMSESNLTFDTVEVNGTFNSWCGDCAQMTDINNDNIWEITMPLLNGSYEYKFSADNWNIEENLYEFDDCVIGSPPYINRSLVVLENQVLDTVCWNRCYSCDTERNFYNVTFQLDMSNFVDPFTIPEINGTFNNWCGNCWTLDNQGNNIYSSSFNVDTSLHSFKFSADNWSIQEELDSNLSCVSINYDPSSPNGWGYVNRYLSSNKDTVLDPVCWDDCIACVNLSWDCDQQGNCFNPGDGSGLFSDSISCVINCQATNVVDNMHTNFIIYPNPTKGFFTINKGVINFDKVIIYNKLGKEILRIDNLDKMTEIDLSERINDLYFIELYNKKQIIRKKIIKTQ